MIIISQKNPQYLLYAILHQNKILSIIDKAILLKNIRSLIEDTIAFIIMMAHKLIGIMSMAPMKLVIAPAKNSMIIITK
jgi:hypothetical protein